MESFHSSPPLPVVPFSVGCEANSVQMEFRVSQHCKWCWFSAVARMACSNVRREGTEGKIGVVLKSEVLLPFPVPWEGSECCSWEGCLHESQRGTTGKRRETWIITQSITGGRRFVEKWNISGIGHCSCSQWDSSGKITQLFPLHLLPTGFQSIYQKKISKPNQKTKQHSSTSTCTSSNIWKVLSPILTVPTCYIYKFNCMNRNSVYLQSQALRRYNKYILIQIYCGFLFTQRLQLSKYLTDTQNSSLCKVRYGVYKWQLGG